MIEILDTDVRIVEFEGEQGEDPVGLICGEVEYNEDGETRYITSYWDADNGDRMIVRCTTQSVLMYETGELEAEGGIEALRDKYSFSPEDVNAEDFMQLMDELCLNTAFAILDEYEVEDDELEFDVILLGEDGRNLKMYVFGFAPEDYMDDEAYDGDEEEPAEDSEEEN